MAINTDYLAHREAIAQHVQLGVSYKDLAELSNQQEHPLFEQVRQIGALVEKVAQAENTLVELAATMRRRLTALTSALDNETSVWDRFGQTGADLDVAVAQRDQAYQMLALAARVFTAARTKLGK